MRASTLISAIAAFGVVSANPTATDKQKPNKRANLPVVTASGNAFYQDDTRFYMRGIDYQPGGSSAEFDPLADIDVCTRDIEKFQDLGINTIRVYMVDNSLDHDECMAALDEAGIYLVLDANTPNYSINRADPYLSYNAAYLQNVFATIDAFIGYDNVLAFFNGNEVINEEEGTDASAPYVKAVGRDMKNYMAARDYRSVPVGYSAADVSSNRMQTAYYFNCGDDDVRSDFFAFNDYSWCNSDFETSGWDVKVENFTDYGLPIFLSEYGCTTNGRDFGEIEALMSDAMTGVYSGGLMYEYTMEDNGFGIVELDSVTADEVTELDEYASFKSAMSAYPAPTDDGGADSTTHSVTCPTQDDTWNVDPDVIPAMPTEAEEYFENGAGTALGLDGPGSQTDGDSGLSATVESTDDDSDDDDDDDPEGAANGLHSVSLLTTGAALSIALFGAILL